ncbi:succinic semialdehyde dehydrogenase [Microlunatus soli]|uniref:Succinate-semialdehyde dehydrogenase / glutarate-semialdehyde dehydrogenase n=1 Tax=Microlunatus soli TaxID=630515 RepID=A0A1H1PYT1_9ACTN|nr:succinic semialdehyde dehydrogenase [Microlunatus soli]SDS16382.1 succinate-semialdehyde dehydrogenase / glutarate-semialdehyde dehydrogenase [Microlunatus soli]
MNDTTAAFAAARAAQPGWAALEPATRAIPFLRLRDLLLDRRSEILDVIQTETGKARLHASEEFLDAVSSIGYYARSGPRLLRPQRRPGALPGLTRTREYARPRGVVAMITPWNYPFALAADVVPALLAGNAVVHKPDSKTTRSSLLLRDLALQSGVDPRLWQPVLGEPADVGDDLIDGADYVSFTGSTAAGVRIAERCAQRVIGCNLELGGKNPMIVLGDADLDRTVPAALRACFSNAGQLCIGVERIYVDRTIHDDFLRRFVTATRMLRLGNGLDYTSDLGALISTEHLERVSGLVGRAISAGARPETGGRPRPDLGPRFYEPTVLTATAPDAEINRSEVFGPVVTVTAVDNDAEAVRLANDSPYGLNAAVFGRDRRRARAVAEQLETGMVNINEGYAAGYGSAAPVGGRKRSGTGRRHGAAGLLTYTQSQIVADQRLVGFDPVAGLSGEQYSRLLARSLRAMHRLHIR